MSVFVAGGKPDNPGETLRARERTNNKRNAHVYDAESVNLYPGCIGEASSLATLLLLLLNCQ